jgi:hypothetical protein
VADFARGFRLTFPDGTQLDGAQFPSGLVVTAHRDEGLRTAAISIGHLFDGVVPADVRIEWDPNHPDTTTKEN